MRIPGRRGSARRRGPAAAALAAAFACLVAPAGAAADTTVAGVQGSALVVSGLPGSPSAVELRYRTAEEAGFGVDPRFEIRDEGGIRPSGPDCIAGGPTVVSCDSVPVATIYAALGDGDDVLVVDSSAADGVPAGLPTLLRGQGGADVIRGGLGDDRIRGDAGRDTVAGWSGDDILYGGAGADGLIGFAGDDRLFGEAGRDALFAQKGRDLLNGGAQNDVLLARDGFKDKLIACGAGRRQSATTDRGDPAPRNCTTPGERKKLKKQAKRRGKKAVASLATVLRSVAGSQGE